METSTHHVALLLVRFKHMRVYRDMLALLLRVIYIFVVMNIDLYSRVCCCVHDR